MSWKNAKVIGSNQKRGAAGQVRGHKDYVMSRSALVEFSPCPGKWREGKDDDYSTKSMDFGSIVDCLATCPAELEDRFAIEPATYKSKGMKCPKCGSVTDSSKCTKCKTERVLIEVDKPWSNLSKTCQDWIQEMKDGGKTVIPAAMFEQAKLAFSLLRRNESILELFECSERQVLISAEWHDKATGVIVPVCGLIDLLPDKSNPSWGKHLADLKTARNGNPALWARVVDDQGYDVQAALYLDIYRAARPNEERIDFTHVVQENTHPFHVVSPPPALSSEFITWGRVKYTNALNRYAQCLATDIWPSYREVGMPFGNTQIIGPESLWSYRQGAGMTDFVAPPERPEKPKVDEEKFDIH